MTTGEVVIVKGSCGPFMCVERATEGVAHVVWFWNGLIQRHAFMLADIEITP